MRPRPRASARACTSTQWHQGTGAMLPRPSPTTARSTSRRRPMRSAAATCTPTPMPRCQPVRLWRIGRDGERKLRQQRPAERQRLRHRTRRRRRLGLLPSPRASISRQAPAAGATASVYNTNAIAVTASANVTVGNAAHRGSYALASAAALGVSQSAFGGTEGTTTAAATFLHRRLRRGRLRIAGDDRRRVHPDGKRLARSDRPGNGLPDQHRDDRSPRQRQRGW